MPGYRSGLLRGGFTKTGDALPLVIVDGNVWLGAPSDISKFQIDRVEVIKRAMPSLGSRSSNGVLLVYTIGGPFAKSPTNLPVESQQIIIKVAGFSPLFSFPEIDYIKSNREVSDDLRATVYWNPDLLISKQKPAVLSFFSADVPTTYRIDIRGLTADGQLASFVRVLTIVK